MRRERFLECLAADQARLREVATRDLTATVPSCPDWTMVQLVDHVAAVYLHKVESMRRGPDDGKDFDWPPDFSGEEPLALLDRAYRALLAEFAARSDDEPSAGWYEPDRTAGFWVRRMAQETVIHRIDAELAAGVQVAEVPTDLAVDGIDEVLIIFLAYSVGRWPDSFTDELPTAPRRVLVGAGTDSWSVELAPTGVIVERQAAGTADAAAAVAADATVTGAPADVLRWLWRRADDEAVTIGGDSGAAGRLRRALGPATQ